MSRFSEEILIISTAHLMKLVGADKCHGNVTAVMVDVTQRYLEMLGRHLKMYAQNNGRTIPNSDDLLATFEEKSIEIDDLLGFFQAWLQQQLQLKKNKIMTPAQPDFVELNGLGFPRLEPGVIPFDSSLVDIEENQVTVSLEPFAQQVPTFEQEYQEDVDVEPERMKRLEETMFYRSGKRLPTFQPLPSINPSFKLDEMISNVKGELTGKRIIPVDDLIKILSVRRGCCVALPVDTLYGSDRGVLDDLFAHTLHDIPDIYGTLSKDQIKSQPNPVTPVRERVETPVSTPKSIGDPSPPKIKLKIAKPIVTNDESKSALPEKVSLVSPTKPSDVINCICSAPTVDYGLFMIACDKCQVWYHGSCVNVYAERDEWICPRHST